MIPYTEAFRSRMVSRLVGPHALTATALAAETGLAQATLSRWLKEASTLRGVKKPAAPKPSATKPSRVKQPQTWSPDEKLAIVLEAATLTEGELGVYLRSKGIHAAMIDEWRAQALGGLRGGEHASKVQIESREIRALRRELARKDKALAETAALLVLKKKVQEIWGDEDDGTDPRSDK